MKANEAPKNIYCESDGFCNIVKAHNIKWPDDEAENIEYTRTDYAEKEFLIKAKRFLSEIHRVCDITDEHGYRIELRELQARLEKYIKGE